MEDKNNLIVLCNWFVLSNILLANGDELNLILPKFACLLYFFSQIRTFGTSEKIYICNRILNDFAFYFATF